MRAASPTSFLLDGRTGWRTGHRAGINADPARGLHLAADPYGPLALGSRDGSLGGLVMPRGMALDGDGILYLLDPAATPRIRRFDPARRAFVGVPEKQPAVPKPAVEAAQELVADVPDPFASANVAIAGPHLFLVDGERIQVFFRHGGRLVPVRLWDDVAFPAAVLQSTIRPADVAVHGSCVYFLDRQAARLWRHRLGGRELAPILDEPGSAGRWSRLAVDRGGRLYLLDASEPARLEVYELTEEGCLEGSCPRPGGPLVHRGFRLARLATVLDAGEVRSRFDAPAVRLDHRERFCLPGSLARLCDRRPPAPAPLEAPLAPCPPFAADGLLFDRRGRPVPEPDPTEAGGGRLYAASGVWITEALDSEVYRCQWHRVELALADLPPGTRVAVSTYSSEDDEAADQVRALPEHLWATRFATTGPMQPPEGESGVAVEEEALVHSGEGRYLWLRLELSGDGGATPRVASIRVHYPRQSYLAYLPAVFSAEEESRSFLERFLSIAQTEWDALERRIESFARHLDPRAVPDGFVDWLASWLALPLEGGWAAEQKRRLLAAAPRFYPRRGGAAALVEVLRIYLWNLTGLAPGEQLGFPAVVEGFRERQQVVLSAAAGELSPGARLWGRGRVGRLQLDVYAREGQARLISTGDPERDLFHEHAHRFRVFVPSVWVRSGAEERLLRRALDLEKPAHTTYEVALVEPRLRVGSQSTVGVDTVVGAIPRARLYCPHRDPDPVPGREPRYRLSYDTVLACRERPEPPPPPPPLGLLGFDTRLGRAGHVTAHAS